MRKNGFTLAEILITLGIIGVVAALTAPGLILRSTQNANASKLSVMVANIENALTGAIASEGVEGLDELDEWTNNDEDDDEFVGNIGRFLHITGAPKSGNNLMTAENYYGDFWNNISGNAGIFGAAAPILTKSGCTLFIHKDNLAGNETDIRQAGGSLVHKAAYVVIDVNGTDEPNQCGIDIFGFYLSNDGILYPIGGNDVDVFEDSRGDDATTFSDFNGTATLVENGYKF